jgi:adenylate cyclase
LLVNRPRSESERRLAAIFCADVAGYVRLMETDEVGTLCLLNAHRDIMARQIAQHRGRTANTAGDSILAEFPSAVDALHCALGVLERIAVANNEIPDERRVIFRIGLHVGEVMVRHGDMFGDGVNIAARMEKLALPGTVCLSGVAFSYVHRTLPLKFDALGPQVVKNHDSPIEAYLVRPLGNLLWAGVPPVHRRSEFNLGRRFHRVLTDALTEVTKPEGLTVVEPAVFASLHDAPGIGEHRLSERIGIGLPSVRRMVRHLEGRGLVCGTKEVGIRGGRLFALTPAALTWLTVCIRPSWPCATRSWPRYQPPNEKRCRTFWRESSVPTNLDEALFLARLIEVLA